MGAKALGCWWVACVAFGFRGPLPYGRGSDRWRSACCLPTMTAANEGFDVFGVDLYGSTDSSVAAERSASGER